MLFEVFYPERLFQLMEFLHQFKEQGNQSYLSIFFYKISFNISSTFTQILQQTGVINELKQAGRSYTLFIPTNAALQSMGVTTNMNRLRQVNIFIFKNFENNLFFIFNSLLFVIYVLIFFLIQ